MRFWSRSAALLAVSVAFLAACSGGGDDNGGTGPDPAFTMSVSPTSVTLEAGAPLIAGPGGSLIEAAGSANVTVDITRTGGFEGPVTVTVEGLPSGVTANSITIAAGSSSGAIAITAGATAAPGTASLTVRGTATGLTARTATVGLTVSSPPSIALALSAASLPIAQGMTGNANVTITRTSFTGAVNLAASGAPAGMTIAFNPASTTNNTSAITVTVGAAVDAGSYQITITGSGTGISDATTTLTVTVTATGVDVTFTFCAQSGIPLWLAAQSPGGAWTQVTGNSGVFSFTINQRGAVAWVMPDGGGTTSLEIAYGTATELADRGMAFCGGTGGTRTINGTTANIGLTEFATIAMRGGTATQFGMAGPFVINNVFDGAVDLVAMRAELGTGIPVPNSIVIQRDLNIASGGSVGTIDFATGVTPAQATATINNLGAEQAIMSALFLTRNATGVNMSVNGPAASSSQMWLGVPTGSTVDGDFHVQSVVALPAGNLTGFPNRSILQFNRTVADRTYTLPAAINTPPTVNVTGTAPFVTATSSWTIQGTDYDDFWSLIYTPASGSVSAVTISGTAGYFGAGPVQLDLPNFGAGFNPAWGLQPGVNVTWIFIANGGPAWNGGFTANNLEGAIAFSASVTGNFTP